MWMRHYLGAATCVAKHLHVADGTPCLLQSGVLDREKKLTFRFPRRLKVLAALWESESAREHADACY